MNINLLYTHLHRVLSVTLPIWKSYSLVRIRITCKERTCNYYKLFYKEIKPVESRQILNIYLIWQLFNCIFGNVVTLVLRVRWDQRYPHFGTLHTMPQEASLISLAYQTSKKLCRSLFSKPHLLISYILICLIHATLISCSLIVTTRLPGNRQEVIIPGQEMVEHIVRCTAHFPKGN